MSYIDGFILPLREGKEDAYLEMAQMFAGKAQQLGAIGTVEGLGDGLEHGHTTDFFKAVRRLYTLQTRSGDAISF